MFTLIVFVQLVGGRYICSTLRIPAQPSRYADGPARSGRTTVDLMTTTGRKVHFDALRIADSRIYVVYSKPDIAPQTERDDAVRWLTMVAAQRYKQKVVMLPPPPDRLPSYTLFGQFSSKTPVTEGDQSHLVVVWFEDQLPNDIPAMLKSVLHRVNWDRSAVDSNSADD